MGDSAVSNLSLVTLQRIRRAGEPAPACAVLLSPAVDCTLDSASMVESQGRGPMLSIERPAGAAAPLCAVAPSVHAPRDVATIRSLHRTPAAAADRQFRNAAPRSDAHGAQGAQGARGRRGRRTRALAGNAACVPGRALSFRGCACMARLRWPHNMATARAAQPVAGDEQRSPCLGCAAHVDLINGPDTRQNLPAISVAQQLHPPLGKELAIHGVAAKPDIKVLSGGVTGGPTTITKTGHAKMS
jgi:acetyl esterase/lipase